jgi:hypothetical protein
MHEQMKENRGKILHIIVCVNERERESTSCKTGTSISVYHPRIIIIKMKNKYRYGFQFPYTCLYCLNKAALHFYHSMSAFCAHRGELYTAYISLTIHQNRHSLRPSNPKSFS